MAWSELKKYGPFKETVFNFLEFLQNVQLSELEKLFGIHISIFTWLKFLNYLELVSFLPFFSS